MKRQRIAIIGAGMSGLACAYELNKQGCDVTVFEKDAEVGGRAGTRREKGYPFDLGAQFLNNGYSQARKYCEELGIEAQWRVLNPSTHHLYHDGQLHCISFTTVGEFLGLSFYSRMARLRLLMCYLRLQRQARGLDLYDLSNISEEFDQVSAKDYILKWGGQEVLDYAFDSMIATYHFHGAEDLSLGCLLGAMSAIGPNFTYDYFTDGIDTLARTFEQHVRVCKGQAVEKVNMGQNGICLTINDGHEIFDSVVIATTASTAKQILGTPSEAQAKLLDTVRFSSTINAGFRVPSALITNLAMVAVPNSQNGNICCYFNQNSKYPWRFDGGQTLVNVFLRDECAKQYLNASDEEIWRFMESEFIKVCPPLKPVPDRVFRHDLQRWPEAIPKYSTGYVSLAKNFWENGQGDQNVYLCGDYLNAPWMEGSLRCGKKVAERILQDANKQLIN